MDDVEERDGREIMISATLWDEYRFVARVFGDEYDLKVAVVDCELCRYQNGNSQYCPHWTDVLNAWVSAEPIDTWLSRIREKGAESATATSPDVLIDVSDGVAYIRFIRPDPHFPEVIEKESIRPGKGTNAGLDQREALDAIIAALDGVSAQDDGSYRIPEPLVGQLLRSVVKTQRCYFDHPSGKRPLSLAEEREVALNWALDGERYKIEASGIDEGTWFLNSVPIVHISDCGLITPISLAGGLSRSDAKHLLKMPAVSTEDAVTVYEKVLEQWPSFPVKPPTDVIDIVDVDDSRLTNVLRIREHEDGLAATLEFRYFRGVVVKETPKPVSILKKHGKTYRILRNLNKEEQARLRLKTAGLEECHGELLRYRESGYSLNRWAMQRLTEPDKRLFWAKFLDSEVERLKSEGWRIFVDKKATIEIIDADSFKGKYEDNSDDPALYSLSLGIDVDGEEVSIIPLVLQVLDRIDEDGIDDLLNETGEFGYLELDDGRIIRIDGDRYRALLNMVWDSITNLNTKRDGFDLPLYEVSTVAKFDEFLEGLIDWQGAGKMADLIEVFNGWREPPEIDVPDCINANLDDYQREGVQRMAYLSEKGFPTLLCDEMGLGKTLQLLTLYAIRRQQDPNLGPMLVAVNTAGVSQWEAQAQKHYPSLRVKQTNKENGKPVSVARRFEMYEACQRGEVDLLITTYKKVTLDILALKEIRWSFAIADEAHLIKNPKTARWKAMTAIEADFRVPATGTPIENGLNDLWSITTFAMPGYLGDKEFFKRQYVKRIEDDGDRGVLKTLKTRIAPVLRRKLRNDKDVNLNIPEPDIEIVDVAISGRQRDLYESVRIREEKQVKELLERVGFKQAQGMVLSNIMGMRQVACDPRIYATVEHKVVESAKLDRLTELLDQIKHDKTPTLCFSKFETMMPLFQKAAKRVGLTHDVISGKVTINKRDNIVTDFRNGENQVLFATLGTMNASIDLFNAKATIIYDPWWNPQTENQGIGRMVRRGQEHKTKVYRLYAKNTVERHLFKKQSDKLALVDAVFKEDINAVYHKLTEDDIDAFFAN